VFIFWTESFKNGTVNRGRAYQTSGIYQASCHVSLTVLSTMLGRLVLMQTVICWILSLLILILLT